MLELNKQRRAQGLPLEGGVVLGHESGKGGREKYYVAHDDIHTLTIGATRSGKSRRFILPTVCYMALAGESMLITDPKSEIYDYTMPYLKRLGYEVIALDFREPLKSSRYNFLQPVINAVNAGDNAKAADLVWDITSALVGEAKGERIWTDGEASIIAGSIMSVVFDNKKHPEFQNFTNVFNFINYMCKAGEKGVMPLNEYIEELDESHPAKSLFGVALLAPSRTRGSFFTAALATLRLFTNPYIYSMTCESEFRLDETGSKKRALFIILPDEKNTYHGVAALFVQQHYIALAEAADRRGGRLERRVNLLLDEFGNFTKIPSFGNMLTVGGGRGIRFNIVIQAYSQLEEIYGKEATSTIKNNCHCTIYLKSGDGQTNEDISRRLGNYTTSSYGRSASQSDNKGSSASMNLISRNLLTSTEVGMISSPYALVMMSGCNPAMMKLPDISECAFNVMLGLGDKDYNIALRQMRGSKRKQRKCEELHLWGIWEDYKVCEDEYEREEQRIRRITRRNAEALRSAAGISDEASKKRHIAYDNTDFE